MPNALIPTISLQLINIIHQTDEASQVLFPCAITAIKISVLLFYRRFFPSTNFRKIAIITGVINILWCIASLLTAFLHCRPLAFYWDKSIKGGVCANDNVIGYSITATELITDIVVLILPIPWLSRLKLERRHRLGVIMLFMLGSLYVFFTTIEKRSLTRAFYVRSVCVAGIVRLPLLGKLRISDATCRIHAIWRLFFAPGSNSLPRDLCRCWCLDQRRV